MELAMSDYVACQRDFLLTLDPERGRAAVTISVPHDGLRGDAFDGIMPDRTGGVQRADLNVWPIAREVAALVAVNLVRGLLPRRVWPR